MRRRDVWRMAEYIDREALFTKVLEEKQFVFRTDDLFNNEVIFRTVYDDFAKFIYSIPVYDDVVEVVRCRDCEHCEVINPNEESIKEAALKEYTCKASKLKKNAHDFCSYGKRKEGAENVT
jgi:hypothetical protein